MKYKSPLLKATLVKRYKRFFADAVLEDKTNITAHCPNTGSMKTCGAPGDTIFVSSQDDPKRKLKYTWELTQTQGGFVGVNTHSPNKIVHEALLLKKIPELISYNKIQPEMKRGKSRLDFYLTGSQDRPPCWLEVKNVTLLEGDTLLFPDAVSERALKHLKSLEEIIKSGERAVLFFLLNRPEGRAFKAAKEIHPEYSAALEASCKNGVEILCYRSVNSPEECYLGDKVFF